MNWVEAFGTAASAVVAVSLTMRNIKRLRILNAAGAVGFAVYGALIGSAPVWILNGFIAAIDVWYLVRMRATRDRFDVIEADAFSSPYVRVFLEFYKDDIARYQPEFRLEPDRGWLTEFILRDATPVSVVVYRKAGDGIVDIGLDYAVPSYRDFRSAEFYFGKAAERIADGHELTFRVRASVEAHRRYLERLGFERADGGPDADGAYEYRMTVRGSAPPVGQA